MNSGVLVVGEAQGLREALEFLLLGRARVRHAFAAGDTEGIDVDVVVAAGSGITEHVRDIRVHPRMHGLPIIALTDDPQLVAFANGVWAVDSTHAAALDDLTERVSWLLSRAGHPSSQAAGRSGAA